jgi:hypothetical protein
MSMIPRKHGPSGAKESSDQAMNATNSVPRRRVANPIVVRRYHVADHPEHEVVVTIGKPRPHGDDWRCSVLIEGIPNAGRKRVYGIDALQALQLSFEYVRKNLDRSGLVLAWLDGGEPGDVAIPRLIPNGWGLAFERKLERYVDREVRRYVNAVSMFLDTRAKKRAHRKAQKQAAPPRNRD